MKQHLDILKNILENGDVKTDRTGTGTTSLFGGMMKFSLQHGVWPIPTTREVDHAKISSELEWMLKGLISVQWLNDHDNKIWNAWAGDNSGTIGPMYGEQWRNWNAQFQRSDIDAVIEKLDSMNAKGELEDPSLTASDIRKAFEHVFDEKTKTFEQGGRGGTDQLAYVIDQLKNNPDSRRIVVNVWHAGLLPDLELSPKENTDIGRMALAPCHSMWQVNTAPLSDMDILREIAYKDEAFLAQLNDGLQMSRGLDSVEVAKYIKMLATGHLKGIGAIYPIMEQDHLHMDNHYELTGMGVKMVQDYKLEGAPTRKLSLACMARSQDVPLGTVFNVGMYSLLAHILAKLTGMVPWEYTHFMGDHHIYHNQHDAVKKQLSRSPLPPARIILDPSIETIEDFDHRNTQVFYEAHEKIVYPRAAV